MLCTYMYCVYMLVTGTYNNYVIYEQPLIKTITSDQFASNYDLFCFLNFGFSDVGYDVVLFTGWEFWKRERGVMNL